MRVTSTMMINNFLSNMNASANKVSKYYDQIATGRNMVRLSDDPIGVLNSMNARQKLLRYEQYTTNLNAAQNWTSQAESAMTEINDVLTDIYSKVEEASSDTNTDQRTYIATEVKEMIDHIMQTANTSVGTQYIFGGFNTSNPPFTRDASGVALYNGLNLSDGSAANLAQIADEQSQNIQFEVGFSNKMDVTVNGVQLMGSGNSSIINMLDSVLSDLKSGASSDVLTQRITDIQKAQSSMMTNIVGMGAKSTKLETLSNRYAKDIIDYTDIKSKIEDVDSAEAIMNWKMSQAVYNQALAAGAKVIQPSLLDFLR